MTDSVLVEVVRVAHEQAAAYERMRRRLSALRADEVQCIYRGAVSDKFRGGEIPLNLPDGRSVMVPIEVRADGIYARFPQAVIDIIEDARRADRERLESMIIFGTPEPPAAYAYTSPTMVPAPRTRAGSQWATGKRAQRRQSKPWADRRQLRR